MARHQCSKCGATLTDEDLEDAILEDDPDTIAAVKRHINHEGCVDSVCGGWVAEI